MDLEALKHYINWIGKSPDEVLRSAERVGGWNIVFPIRPPLWAHKIRNYFNETPLALKRLDEDAAKKLIERARRRIGLFALYPIAKEPPPSDHDMIAESFALSGDVYEDPFRRIWYQMSAGATIYHWGNKPSIEEIEAPWQSIKGGQQAVPVFKLVSPDGTGGSCECIISSLKEPGISLRLRPRGLFIGGPIVPVVTEGYQSTIGAVNKWILVAHRIIATQKHQGSYNYSETIVKGLTAHNMRDVQPHAIAPNGYVDPLRFTPLAERHFPSNDLQGNPLANQVSYR